MSKTDKTPIWDLPTRLFHWSLAGLLGAAWITVELNFMEWHERCGFGVLVLIGFRITWGFVGSHHSRFANFLRGPQTVLRYARGNPGHVEGHNPAGGWSVLAMLLLALTQGVTGLFNADDVAFSGPLAHLVDSNTADLLAEWHEWNFNLLLALVALHIGAIAFYRLRRQQDLLRPMLNGGQSSIAQARTAPAWLALLLLLASAALLWWLLSLAPPPQVFL